MHSASREPPVCLVAEVSPVRTPRAPSAPGAARAEASAR